MVWMPQDVYNSFLSRTSKWNHQKATQPGNHQQGGQIGTDQQGSQPGNCQVGCTDLQTVNRKPNQDWRQSAFEADERRQGATWCVLQPELYRCFAKETGLLESYFGGLGQSSSYVLGEEQHGLQWHIYVASMQPRLLPPRVPTYTLEVCMTELCPAKVSPPPPPPPTLLKQKKLLVICCPCLFDQQRQPQSYAAGKERGGGYVA